MTFAARRIGMIASAVALGGSLFYFYGGHDTPDGQPPLIDLVPGNFASLKDAFNAASSEVRVVLMFSPT